MARRKVSLEQKAEALAVYAGTGGNASATARATGFSDQSILNWSTLGGANFLALLEEKKRALGVGFATLTEILLNRAQAEHDQLQITDRNFVSLLGVSAEKALLFAGQPTEITEHRVRITVEEAERDLQKFLLHFPTRAEAIEALRSVDPDCAEALGAVADGALAQVIEIEG